MTSQLPHFLNPKFPCVPQQSGHGAAVVSEDIRAYCRWRSHEITTNQRRMVHKSAKNVKNFPMVLLRCIIPKGLLNESTQLQLATASNWFVHLDPKKIATCFRWNASAAACKRVMWGCSSLLSSWTGCEPCKQNLNQPNGSLNLKSGYIVSATWKLKIRCVTWNVLVSCHATSRCWSKQAEEKAMPVENNGSPAKIDHGMKWVI